MFTSSCQITLALGWVNLLKIHGYQPLRSRYLTLLFGTFLAVTCMAQPHRVQVLNANNGMPSSTVVKLAQASDGTMWYLLRTGVASFDGRHWQTFGTGDGLPAVTMTDLAIDAQDRVWVTTNLSPHIAAFYDGRKWQTIPQVPGYPYNKATVHRMAIATADGRTRIGIVSRLGALVYEDGVWMRFVKESGLPSNGIRVIIADHAGREFFVGTDKGVVRIGESGVQPIVGIPERNRNVYGLALGRKGTMAEGGLLVYTTNLIGYLDASNKWHDLVEIPDSYYTNRPEQSTLYQDRAGDLWFGDRFGAFHYRVKEKSLTKMTRHHGLVGDDVNDILEDRENQIVIASDRGLSFVSRLLFRNHNNAIGLLEDEVSSVFEWRPGVFLFGHNEGLTLYDGYKYTKIPFPIQQVRKSVSRAMEICGDGKGGVLVAASALGVIHITADLKKTYYPLKLENDRVAWAYSVQRTSDGEVLVGSSAGLWVMRGQKFEPYLPGLTSGLSFRRVLAGDDGLIVLATFGDGILIKRDGTWEHFRNENAGRNNAYDIIQTSQGRILLGSEGGVLEFVDGKIRPYSATGFFLKRPTFFLLEDDEGRLWCGTDAGLYRHDGRGMRHFDISDGLSGLECNRDGAFKDHNGNLWFGTVGGVSQFQEAFDIPKVPPILNFSGGTVGAWRFGPRESVRVNHEENTLKFYFDAVSFAGDRQIFYSAWLDGLERSWGPEQLLTDAPLIYQNLQPGSYRLKLRVRNDLNVWTPNIQSGVIVIEKPFWHAWWVWAGAVAILVLMIYAISDYRSSKRHGLFLKTQVREATWELTRKNQMLEERIEAHARAKREVQALNEELEARVLERTAELEAAQKDLIESAHYEGMAEIATSMLHNVGNILNSVSTSGFLIREQLEKSKVDSMGLAAEMLEPRVDDFEVYLQEDPKARNLLRFYLNLGDKLQCERDKMMNQVGLLLEKVDTIKDVVSQQHNYTSGVYQTEVKPPIQLVDTALKITEASLLNNGIEVIRDLHVTPPIALQKTKMIHTLVNLFKNAGEAVMEGGLEKKIWVSVSQVGEEVYISVRDTGCGIGQEHLEKIFNHGYTTKEEGHGFGLHSCANAVREMGGRMWAESDGLGHGSTFILAFPIPDEP